MEKDFEGIPKEFRLEQTGDPDRVAAVALGWILWSDFRLSPDDDGIRGPGKCDPSADWKNHQCLEDHGYNIYVIKQQKGHAGWPVHAIGAAAIAGRSAHFFEWLGTVEASKVLGDYFIVMPHDEARKGRTVRFEFYMPGSKEPLRPRDGSQLPKESPDISEGSTTLTVCGARAQGPSLACPNYDIPPERLPVVKRAMGWK